MKKVFKGMAVVLTVIIVILCGCYIKKENLYDKYRNNRAVHVINKDFKENNKRAKAELYHNTIDNDYSCIVYEYDEYGKVDFWYTVDLN